MTAPSFSYIDIVKKYGPMHAFMGSSPSTPSVSALPSPYPSPMSSSSESSVTLFPHTSSTISSPQALVARPADPHLSTGTSSIQSFFKPLSQSIIGSPAGRHEQQAVTQKTRTTLAHGLFMHSSDSEDALPHEPSSSDRPLTSQTPLLQTRTVSLSCQSELPQTWSCAACTLFNEMSATICAACDTPRAKRIKQADCPPVGTAVVATAATPASRGSIASFFRPTLVKFLN
jgi:hypothetical protein